MGLMQEWSSALITSKSRRRIVLTVAAFCTFLPFYLLLIYMSSEGFYAFDIFSNVFGIVAPFLLMAFAVGILLLLLAFFLWGGPMLLLTEIWTASQGDAQSPSVGKVGVAQAATVSGPKPEFRRIFLSALPVLIFNLVIWIAGVYAVSSAPEVAIVLRTFAIASAVLALILVLASVLPRRQRANLGIVAMGLVLLFPFLAQDLMHDCTEATLRQFRLGGVAVTIADARPGGQASGAAGSAPEQAYLVFLSASNLYLQVGCPARTVILPRGANLRLEFEANRMTHLDTLRCEDEPAKRGT